MRLVLLTDSHGKGMVEMVNKYKPDWELKIIRVGRKASAVSYLYDIELSSIGRFKPSSFLVHLGHNDLCYHSVCNQQPMSVSDFMGILETFLLKIRIDFPHSGIMYSSLLPRSVGPRMGFEQHLLYNLMAISFADQARARLNSLGYDFVSNESLWYNRQEGIEHPIFFGADGLHLRAVGQEFVAKGWIEALVGLHETQQR
jgi:hypothetical protein